MRIMMMMHLMRIAIHCWGRFFSSGICCITDVGASVKSSKSAVALSKKWPQIYAAVGVHPDSTADMTEEDIETLRSLAQEKKVVAIGEIGLDYYWDNSPREVQKKWFERQLALAREVDLPVIIHSREAAKDTMDIMREAAAGRTYWRNSLLFLCSAYGKRSIFQWDFSLE